MPKSKTKGTRVTLVKMTNKKGSNKSKTKSRGDGRHVARNAGQNTSG